MGAPIRSIVRRRLCAPGQSRRQHGESEDEDADDEVPDDGEQVMPSQAIHLVPAGSMTPPWIAKAASVASHPRTKMTAEAS